MRVDKTPGDVVVPNDLVLPSARAALKRPGHRLVLLDVNPAFELGHGKPGPRWRPLLD